MPAELCFGLSLEIFEASRDRGVRGRDGRSSTNARMIAMLTATAVWLRRTPGTIPRLLDQAACLHPVEFCEVLIDHHVACVRDDPLLDRWEWGSAPAYLRRFEWPSCSGCHTRRTARLRLQSVISKPAACGPTGFLGFGMTLRCAHFAQEADPSNPCVWDSGHDRHIGWLIICRVMTRER